jgi:hypothetical protein
MKRILLSAAVFTSLVFAGLLARPAEAHWPYRGYAVVGGSPTIVLNAGYGAYNPYTTYSAYGYSNYGTYVSPNYGFSVAPYGAGYIGGYQPYQQMYYQRLNYGLGY